MARSAPRLALLACAVCLLLPAAASAAPIPSAGVPTLPAYDGAPATPRPIAATIAEQNPFMAPNPNSNIHNDTWMTDAYQRPGPLGASPATQSEAKQSSVCGSLAFDSRGRIVTVCPSIPFPPFARLIDPVTLETIDEYELPDAEDPPGTREFQNFSGGGYFFLDEQDRMWVPTKTNHIFVLGQNADGTEFELVADYDLTGVLDSETERIPSALPDFRGRIWFVSKANGKVGTLDPESGRLRVKRTGEETQNSFAVARDGVYIVSDTRMYRYKAGRKGIPRVVWKKRYPDTGEVKPSMVNAGSGTTPTVMKGGYVAIADNADPINIVVYRRGRREPGEKREVCRVPVFEPGRSATENTLITAGRSLIVENNYGYDDPFDGEPNQPTEPGFARVDVKRNGRGCKLRWTNTEARGASVVPKASTENGLIYTYTRPPDPSGAEGYYWTAIDFRSGETVFNQYAGSGLLYNNNYAGLALGPDGSAYLGVIGGIIALRDG